MNSPTWTTVFGALCVGLIAGQALGFVYAMIIEQRLNKWQRDMEAMERKMQKNKEKTP